MLANAAQEIDEIENNFDIQQNKKIRDHIRVMIMSIRKIAMNGFIENEKGKGYRLAPKS
jgi:hypothetical protein